MLVERDQTGVVKVILNRPSKLNALDMKMFNESCEVATRLKEDKSVRVIILSGAGRAFCSGLDVVSVASNPFNFEKLLAKPAGTAITNIAQDVGYLWREIPVPVIAVLHGVCLGGGLQIALGADIRLSTADCKLSVMEAKWGLIPDMSASITLRELVRADVAKELTFTGRVIRGEEAARLGLVTRVETDPAAAAAALALEMVARSPDAIASAKQLYQRSWVADERTALEEETKLQRALLPSWNQAAASAGSLGVKLPYAARRDDYDPPRG